VADAFTRKATHAICYIVSFIMFSAVQGYCRRSLFVRVFLRMLRNCSVCRVYVLIFTTALLFMNPSKSDWECKLQGCVLQAFGLNTTIYVAVMTLEGLKKTDHIRLTVSTVADSSEEVSASSMQRYAVIHASILAVGIIETIILLLTDDVGPLPAFGRWLCMSFHVATHCVALRTRFCANVPGVRWPACFVGNVCFIINHRKLPLLLLFACLPGGFCLFTIILANWTLASQIFRVFDYFMPDSENEVLASGDESRAVSVVGRYKEIMSRLDPDTKKEFRRLIFSPVAYALYGMPILCLGFFVVFSTSTAPTRPCVVALCIIALFGVINSMIWVVSDPDIRADWSYFLQHREARKVADCTGDDGFRFSVQNSMRGTSVSEVQFELK
jgi:hypothetical protein